MFAKRENHPMRSKQDLVNLCQRINQQIDQTVQTLPEQKRGAIKTHLGTLIEELTKGDASTESINLALKQFRAHCRQELGEEHWALSFAKGLANCAFLLTASFLYVVGCIFIGALCGVLLVFPFPFPPLIALGVGGGVGALLGALCGLDTVYDFAEEIKSRPTLSPIKEELEPIFSCGMLNDSL